MIEELFKVKLITGLPTQSLKLGMSTVEKVEEDKVEADKVEATELKKTKLKTDRVEDRQI
jgi:hypothetical protein